MFRYETISSHDGKYELSALIKEEGYTMSHFSIRGYNDFAIDNDSYIIETFLPELEKCILDNKSYFKDGINIGKEYLQEIKEMILEGEKLGYFNCKIVTK